MSKKLIIINGIMGVGKSTVCRNLYKKLDNCFFLEGDDCWRMNPFTVNDENKKMVIENITYMLNSFIKNSSSKYILFNWVIQTDEIMKSILERLDLDGVDVYRITLMCSREELEKRIRGSHHQFVKLNTKQIVTVSTSKKTIPIGTLKNISK